MTIANSTPGAPTSITFLPADPTTDQDITPTATGALDADGDSLTYSYEWAISFDGGTTFSGWLFANPTLPALATEPGDQWKCRARASDSLLTGAWYESPTILTIGASRTPPSVPTDIAFSTTTPATTDDITATASGSIDPDADPITYYYEWSVSTDGGVIWSAYGYAGATLLASQTGAGQRWKCRARADAIDGSSGWYESPTVIAVANTAPTAPTIPVILPAAPLAGQDLSITPAGSTDPDSDPITYSSEWRHSEDGGANWSLWSSAGTSNNGATLLGAATAMDQQWQARVQASDGNLTSAWSESAAVTVGDTAPTAPTSVSISPVLPSLTQGLTAAATGSVDPDGQAVTYNYEWAKSTDGVNWGAWGNPGARIPSALTAIGDYWKARASATAGGLTSAWVESAPVKVQSMFASTKPVADATAVARDTTISLSFTWPMNTASVESHFSLVPAGGAAVAGTFTWTSTRAMVFKPSAPLQAGVVYTATLSSGILRSNGTVLNWSEPFSFTTHNGPVVTAFSPTGASVPTATTISATFDMPMNKTKVQNAVRLQVTGTLTNKSGTFSWPSASQFVFTPSAPLVGNTSYTVTLQGNCWSLSGLQMKYSKAWTFTTATAPVLALTATGTAAKAGNGATAISVNLSSAASVEVTVMNLSGRTVAVLPVRDLPAGVSTLTWNGRSLSGTQVPSGTYLIRLSARSKDGSASQCLLPLQQ